MSQKELILAAQDVARGLEKMHDILPACDDNSLLIVARALNAVALVTGLRAQEDFPRKEEASDADVLCSTLAEIGVPVRSKNLLLVLRKKLNSPNLHMNWLRVQLRGLHAKGRVRVARRTANNTAYWEAVR
jgi:hypothetical protein